MKDDKQLTSSVLTEDGRYAKLDFSCLQIYVGFFNEQLTGRAIVADQQPDSSTKRRIVKNPETFRERAIKATEQSGKESKRSKLAGTPKKVLSPIGRPIGRAGTRVGKLKPVKIVGKGFHYIGLVVLPRYIRNSWKELRMVSWPSWTQSRKLTFAVIVFAAIFGVIVAGVDYGLDKLFKQVLLK